MEFFKIFGKQHDQFLYYQGPKSKFRKFRIFSRGVSGGWAIAHTVFGRIEGATRQRLRTALLLAHTDLGKGQLISKGNFGVFNSSKKQT